MQIFQYKFFSFFVNKFICLILGWLSNRNGKSYQCIRSSCKVGLSVVSLEQINVLLYSCKEESLVPLMLQSLIVFIVTLHRRIIHTVGPKYAVKYHTAAENALSHCYRSCLELLIENGLQRLVAQLFSLSFLAYLLGVIHLCGTYLSALKCECSIAVGCIYTEAKNYPREPAAHVAISKILFTPFRFHYSGILIP